jgi:hypothetical protein
MIGSWNCSKVPSLLLRRHPALPRIFVTEPDVERVVVADAARQDGLNGHCHLQKMKKPPEGGSENGVVSAQVQVDRIDEQIADQARADCSRRPIREPWVSCQPVNRAAGAVQTVM